MKGLCKGNKASGKNHTEKEGSDESAVLSYHPPEATKVKPFALFENRPAESRRVLLRRRYGAPDTVRRQLVHNSVPFNVQRRGFATAVRGLWTGGLVLNEDRFVPGPAGWRA